VSAPAGLFFARAWKRWVISEAALPSYFHKFCYTSYNVPLYTLWVIVLRCTYSKIVLLHFTRYAGKRKNDAPGTGEMQETTMASGAAGATVSAAAGSGVDMIGSGLIGIDGYILKSRDCKI
jgi:hypothetical protein